MANREILRVLRPDGIAVIGFPSGEAAFADRLAGLLRDLQEAAEARGVSDGGQEQRGEQLLDERRVGAEVLDTVCMLTTVAGRHFAAYSLGNPQAVAFVGADEDPEQLARTLGPIVERDPQFPARTNVEFARCEPDGSLTVWVWERGCGITQACGTGACATAVAACLVGLAAEERWLSITLPGGSLQVMVKADLSEVYLRGPARYVFRGGLSLG